MHVLQLLLVITLWYWEDWMDERTKTLKSVEAFNFESYTWEELPEMSQGRYFHAAVVV